MNDDVSGGFVPSGLAGVAPGLVAVFEVAEDASVRTIATGDQLSVVLGDDPRPVDLPRVLAEHLRAALDADGPIRFEISRRAQAHAAARTYLVSLVHGVATDADAEHRRYVAAFASDVTRAERRVERLLRLSPDGVVVVDRDGRIVLVNEQAGCMFGYDGDDLVGEQVEVLLPERCRRGHVRHRDELAQKLHVGRMGTGLELCGLRRDGSEFPVAISLAPLEGEEGHVVIATMRDLTGAHRARETEQHLREVRERQEQALELNDDVIQGLSTAWLALENDEHDLAQRVIERTLESARDIVSGLLHASGGMREGTPDLVRATRAPSFHDHVEPGTGGGT